MKHINKEEFSIEHEFVEFIPPKRDADKVYVSIPYATAVHDCFCGCRTKVVTPFSPTGWRLIFDGDTVSLDPSIGNWGFDCRSHYWIRRNRVVWAGDMSQEEIDWGRARDRAARDAYFGGPTCHPKPARPKKRRFWDWLLRR